jgi:hypothetical protein
MAMYTIGQGKDKAADKGKSAEDQGAEGMDVVVEPAPVAT